MTMKDKQLFTDQTIIVTSRTKRLLLGIAHRYLTADGNNALYFPADVRNSDSSQQLAHYAIAKTGRLDVLINNPADSSFEYLI